MASAQHYCSDCKCSGCPGKPVPVKKKTEVVLKANLTCKTCQKKIEKALISIKGVEAVDLNVGKNMITVKGEDLKKEVCLQRAQKVGKATSLWPEEDLKRMKEEAEKKKKAEEEKKKKEEEEKKKKEEEEKKKKKKEEEDKKKAEEENKKKKDDEEKVVVVYKYLDPPYYANCPIHYCQQGCYSHGQYPNPNNNCPFM